MISYLTPIGTSDETSIHLLGHDLAEACSATSASPS